MQSLLRSEPKLTEEKKAMAGEVVTLPKRKPGGSTGLNPGRGGRPVSRMTVKTRQIAEEWIANGNPLPLNVMLENMVYYHEQAARLLDECGLWNGPPKNDKERKERFLILKAIGGHRQSAEQCAVDAAPYLHPALKSIEFDTKDDRPYIIQFSRGDEKL